MSKKDNIIRELQTVFEVRQAEAIAKVVTDAYDDLVKTSDFNELKEIVRDLAEGQKQLTEAQNRTEQKVEELAQAQNRTEQRVAELAEGQNRTEQRVAELAEGQRALQEGQKALQEGQKDLQEATVELKREMATLARRMGETNSTLGGLGQSVSYALENEAYRLLPAFLTENYEIGLTERLIRTEIEGEEINIFGRGTRNGTNIVVVGESKLRMDERRRSRPGRKNIFEQLDVKVEAVEIAYPNLEIVQILITHYARPSALKLAEEEGIIVVQSFEW